MMSTVGLDLTNFINPELTWKTVAKGSRSGSRRSRKPVGRSVKPGVEFAGKCSKIVEESSVSESEKHGVAILGRRFGDKVADVPIKKRRLMPRTPSPVSEEFEQLVVTQCTSGQRSHQNLISQLQAIASHSTFAMFGHVVDDRKVQKESDQKYDCSEDFSGIEILAAAACNNSMCDNFDNAEEVPVVNDFLTQEGIDSSTTSTSAIPVKETIESLDAPKDFARAEEMDGVSTDSTMGAFLHDYPPKNGAGTLSKSVVSQDRSHWDLNTLMEAWEPICDDHIVNSQKNVSEGNSFDVMHSKKLENSEGCEIQRDLGDAQPATESMTLPTVGRVVLGDVHEGVHHMLASSRGQGSEDYHTDVDDYKFEACPSSGDSSIQETFVPTLAEIATKESTFIAADASASPQVFSMDSCSWTSEGNKNAESGNGSIKHCNGVYVSGIQLGLAICSKSVQFEKTDVALPAASLSEKTAGETLCVFEEAVSYSSVDCVDLSASNVHSWEGEHTISVDTKGHDDKASIDDVTTVDPPVRVEPKELMDKSRRITAVLETQGGFTSHEANKICRDDSASQSGKIDLEYPLDDSYDSGVSQDNHGHIVGMEYETKHQEGYESQYEDGELREPDVYCWQGNETEDGEAEQEQVDYESDNGGTCDFDAADNSVSLSGQVEGGIECGKQRIFGSDHFDCKGDKINTGKAVRHTTCQHYFGVSLAKDDTEAELSKRELRKASNTQLRQQFTERNGNEKFGINIIVENGLSGEYDDVNKIIKHSTGGKDLKESSQSVSSKMKLSGWDQFPDGCGVSSSVMTAEIDAGKFVVPRENRRELLSCVDVPSDGLDRKDTRVIQQSRSTNLDDSYPHCVRVTGSHKLMRRGRSPLHMHDRSRVGGRWVDHSADDWESKHRPSYRYYGPYDSEHPGPKNVSVNSKCAYSRAIRRSPVDSDAAYGMSTGMAAMRDICTNSRGRSGRYAQGFGRGTMSPRKGYHEPVLDDNESSVRVPYYLARRDQTFSPNQSLGAPHFLQSHKKSQSRSRSRSPPMWLLEKERSVGLRHFSRSPDFRSEARMDRARFPIQKPSFAADYEAGFMSPPRNCFSPQQNSRWIDNQDCAVDHFRDRRSPVRMFRQSQRFDSVAIRGRLKSDDYFRPTTCRGRFDEIAAADRGHRYEGGNECRRKYDDRFEAHPGRYYDRDGFVRRIRYDGENGFVAHSSHGKDDCVRGTDRRPRDIPRKVREEKGQLRNNHDRMYDSGPKTCGMQEYDGNARLRNNHDRTYDSGPKTWNTGI